ncbi:hypothetical protein DFP72DRAFT_1171117 [Ephemerocybe angulata]|uniref:F-box domain-containing protein n=1 Tax=Ephemerocybe angulata TaxID=980116 RepID=A0A8H6M6P3_9AGAR|nr:hypothetical protein DFP72DRAFT_1171117 [Tulosesus angulatus]
MNRSPFAPEVIRNVCDHMDDPTLLSMALTSKDFLEPALDTLWRDLTSFKPLLSCLPDINDLWIMEEFEPPIETQDLIEVLYPRRAITQKDLGRYLAFYAPRIRRFRPYIHGGIKINLSVEALQALQLASGGKPGVLSPLLREFCWPSPDVVSTLLGEDAKRQLSPYMSLFLGDALTTIMFDVPPELPLHAGSLDQALNRHPRLKRIAITSKSEMDRVFIEKCITSSPLEYLERISVPFVTAPMIQHLALRPQLNNLEVLGESTTDIPSLPTITGSATINGFFPNLRSITISRTSLSTLQDLLRCIPSANGITDVICGPTGKLTTSDIQGVIKAISARCNPSTLTNLEFSIDSKRGSVYAVVEEPLEGNTSSDVDISPLFGFGELRNLNLCLGDTICLTPTEISAIPVAFPKIRTLALGSNTREFRPPRLDHTHFISLLQSCPSLTELRLFFDTTGMIGEVVPGAPFQLATLEVGNSPIYSPSRVLSFMKANLPSLYYVDGPMVGLHNHNPPIFYRRWRWVNEQLPAEPSTSS